MRTHVKQVNFTCVNRIEATYEVSCVNGKVKRGSTSTFTSPLFHYYASTFYASKKYATMEIHPETKCPRKVVFVVVDRCAHSLVNVMYNHNILYL